MQKQDASEPVHCAIDLPFCLCTWLLPDHTLWQPPSHMRKYQGKCIYCHQLAQFWPPICLAGDAWSHLCILIGPCRPYHDLSHAPHGSTNCHCSYVYYTAGDIQQAQADTTQETAAVRQTCKQYIPGKAGAAALELGHHLLPCQGLICSYFLSIMADRELQHTCPDSASSKLQRNYLRLSQWQCPRTSMMLCHRPWLRPVLCQTLQGISVCPVFVLLFSTTGSLEVKDVVG